MKNKKTLVILLWALLAVLIYSFIDYTIKYSYKLQNKSCYHKQNLSITLPKTVIDAKTLQIYLRNNFYYHPDIIPEEYLENWQAPEVFDKTKIGDCDDFAVYTCTCLKQLGYEANTYTLFGIDYKNNEYGHAICVFKENDSYNIFSNSWIINTLQKNPIAAIEDGFSDWIEIYEWYPTKFGFITKQDLEKTAILVKKRFVSTKKQHRIDQTSND